MSSFIFVFNKQGLGSRGVKHLSYIHLGSSVCHPVCHPVFHPVCHPVVVAERWAILYVLLIKLTKETRRRVSRRRDYRWRDRRWGDWRGRVWIEFSLFKPNLRYMRFRVPPAVALLNYIYKQWYTLADFLPNWDISRGSLNTIILS